MLTNEQEIREQASKWNECDEYPVRECEDCPARHVADKIPALLDEVEQRWISVEEAQPSVDDVLILRQGESVGVAVDMGFLEYGDWFAAHDGEPLDDVTHWMPLPEPPQEEAP